MSDKEINENYELKVRRNPQSLLEEYPRKGNNIQSTHYCSGCGHGIIHKLIAECMDELGIQDRCIMISPVGCSVYAYFYFNCGNFQTAHGRAPAVATGISRAEDDSIVMSYQGDGDLASIGLNETLQAANRGEKIAVFFVNNTVYGMTGGQMAPTTLIGEKTVTCQTGRDPNYAGHPTHMCELINTLKAPVYIERVSLANPLKIRLAKYAIKQALTVQKEGKGYSFVEILSPCPTNLKQDVKGAQKFIEEQMEKEFPVKNFRNDLYKREAIKRPVSDFSTETLDKIFNVTRDGNSGYADDQSIAPTSIKVSGFGGQGVLSAGLTIAHAACDEGKHVSWYPSYGPEQRGGKSNCSVVISNETIGTPVVDEIDILIALNKPSLEQFSKDVKTGGTILYDSKIGEFETDRDVNVISMPCVDIAEDHGNARTANTALLGALTELTDALKRDSYENAIRDMFASKPKVIDVNIDVLKAGAEWLKNNS